MAVGAKLRELRTERGWSTRKLAKELGVSPPMISNYERGITRIDADELPRIGRIFGVRPGAFYGDEEMRPLTMAEIIRALETLAQSQDSPDGTPSGLPLETAGHPASDGGQQGDDRMESGSAWRQQLRTLISARHPELVPA